MVLSGSVVVLGSDQRTDIGKLQNCKLKFGN